MVHVHGQEARAARLRQLQLKRTFGNLVALSDMEKQLQPHGPATLNVLAAVAPAA